KKLLPIVANLLKSLL
nr:Chain A, temporinB_KKG6A [synthetic construct]